MTPDEIPAGHKRLLNDLAGRPHSDEGDVMAALAEILTVDRATVRAEIVAEIEAEAAGITEDWVRARGIADGLRRAASVVRRRTIGQHLTEDPDDPRLTHGPDPADAPYQQQAEVYLVLSESERAKGFVRPLRRSYWHETCGRVTTMGKEIAATYARDPSFYGGTYCVHCGRHRPVGVDGEFRWCDPDDPGRQSPTLDPKVGT